MLVATWRIPHERGIDGRRRPGPARRYTRVMNDPIKIYLANARLNDPIAMQRLLASPPPDGERETVAGSMRSGPGIGFSYDSAGELALPKMGACPISGIQPPSAAAFIHEGTRT